ncbi:MAG TPA: ATP-binding cassette domain-containing protein [Tissierellaceae bacterium]|nr:ATP-binding cassette domain-containing protein [Tissierellaceae bacterium]
MINCDDVSLVYQDGTLALKNVNLNIDCGELVYIIGPSGSGKTSFLKLIMGMEYPSTGLMKVLGQTIRRDEEKKIRRIRQEMGPVFQDFRLVRGRTALENTILGMRFLNLSNSEIKSRAEEALERVGLEDKKFTLVERLSWGQSQRVAIARAIARKPRLIIADEPTGNLDYENAMNILNLLISLKEEDTTVVITTHATHLIDELHHGSILYVNKGSIKNLDLEGAYI